jgi:hypothetical protein
MNSPVDSNVLVVFNNDVGVWPKGGEAIMKSKSVGVVAFIAAFLLCTSEAQTVPVGMEFPEWPRILCLTSQIGEMSSIGTRPFKKQYRGRYNAVDAYSVVERPSVQTYMFELIGAFAGGIIGAMPTAVMGLAYYPNAGDIYPQSDILSWHPILYAAAAGGILVGPYSVMRVGRRLPLQTFVTNDRYSPGRCYWVQSLIPTKLHLGRTCPPS